MSSSSDSAQTKRRPGRPARSKADSDQTREMLLDAAIKLFARNGYNSVSTGDIAKAANFTQSMVHYHFGSKEQIWRDAVTQLMRRRGPIFAPMKLKHSDLNPIAKLEMLIRNLAAANAAHPDYARIIMQESIANTDRLQWLIREFLGPGFKAFDEAVIDAQEKGLIRKMPVHDVTNIVTSTVSLTYSLGPILQTLYGVDLASEDYLESLSASIVEVLFIGLKVRD